MSEVIDTNVLVVADARSAQASDECVETCAATLRTASGSVVVLDSSWEIMGEYRRNVQNAWPLGPAASFFRQLNNNLYNVARCHQVDITPHTEREYEEFPDDPRLEDFDRSDRKFVAVSVASGQAPPIRNAVDSDWWPVREVLHEYGVDVTFLCPDSMPPD